MCHSSFPQVFSLFPGDPKEFQSAAPPRSSRDTRVWKGDADRPPSCTGIPGTVTAAAPGPVRAPRTRRNAAARPFHLVLRHSTG